MHASPEYDGQDAASVLAASRQALVAARIDGPSAVSGRGSFEAAHSRLLDEFLRARLGEMRTSGALSGALQEFALVAVGGYGRRELSLASDIDLVIVCRRKIPPGALDLAQPLFLPLWDLGFSLGHGFRTIADCVHLSQDDPKVLASLLDMRFVAGSRGVFTELAERMQKKVFGKRRDRFLKWLQNMREERLERFGDGSALLEPHLKEGGGGLRDYHSVLWLAHFLKGGDSAGQDAASLLDGILDGEERRMLRSGAAFVLRARNQLHRIGRRKNDLLYLDLQPPIAERLGFEDRGRLMGVERFLGGLHRSMADIKSIANAFWREHFGRCAVPRSGGNPTPEPPQVPVVQDTAVSCDEVHFAHYIDELSLKRDPLPVMRLFLASARTGLPVGWKARRLATGVRRPVAKQLAGSSEAAMLFRETLYSGRAWPALEQMLETGVLGAFFPEFGKVQDRVQFDAYHTHPVGPHTLRAIRHLEDLPRERVPVFSELWKSLSDRDRRILLQGALFHDIAKGTGDHEALGAEMSAWVLSRWAVDDDAVEDVIFLVRRHLLLAVTATRRDLSDESVVMRCAGLAGSTRRLDMLYLLAYADSRATGPKAWNEWSMRLLAELYAKARHILERGGMAADSAARSMERTEERVRELLRGDPLPDDWTDNRLGTMPARYVQAMDAGDIVRHLQLVREFEKSFAEAGRRLSPERAALGLVELDPVRLDSMRLDSMRLDPMRLGAAAGVSKGETDPVSGMWRLAVAAHWHKGLFAALTGVLALHDINIFSADVFVWADGTVLDVFTVSDPPDPLFADEYWSRVRGAVRFALTGKLRLAERLAEKRAAPTATRSGSGPVGAAVSIPGSPVTVTVDNDSSDFYTVIEVRAPDRLGVLFDMADVLSDMGMVIHVARIATDGDFAMDVFYVRDETGGRLTDPDRGRELERALKARLGHP